MKLNNVMAFAALCVSNCVASDVSEMVNNKLKVESLRLKKESLLHQMNEIDHQMKEITGQNSTSVSVQKGIERALEAARCTVSHLSPLSLHLLIPPSFAERTSREDSLHVYLCSPPHTLPSACSAPSSGFGNYRKGMGVINCYWLHL